MNCAILGRGTLPGARGAGLFPDFHHDSRLPDRNNAAGSEQEAMSTPLTPARRDELIETIACRLSAWNLNAPAIFLLQLHAPLAFLGGQLLFAAEPLIATLTGFRLARDLALLVEEPENVERLVTRLEQE